MLAGPPAAPMGGRSRAPRPAKQAAQAGVPMATFSSLSLFQKEIRKERRERIGMSLVNVQVYMQLLF